MPMLVAGLLLLWLSSILLRGFVKANPAVLSRRLRKAGGTVAIGFALFMMVRGQFNLAFGAATLGLWLLGTRPGWAANLFGGGPKAGPFTGRGGGPQTTRVRTAALEMSLDQATGRIFGTCLLGPAAGRALDDLSQADCVALQRWCDMSDPPGARLLETYLDRRFPAWRQAGQAGDDAGYGSAGSGRQKRTGMSDREAYQVLGLAEGADKEEITRAHREMMKRYHPDHGGSTATAARVNEAKDVLMRRHP